MEQVTKTVAALNEYGFSDISMFECLVRPHEVSTQPRPLNISNIIRKLQDADVKREERRQRQIANAILRNSAKRKREEETNGADQIPDDTPQDDLETSAAEPKRVKTDQATPMQDIETPVLSVEKSTLIITPSRGCPENIETQVVSRVISEVRGHTSYLTFAIKLPLRTLKQ